MTRAIHGPRPRFARVASRSKIAPGDFVTRAIHGPRPRFARVASRSKIAPGDFVTQAILAFALRAASRSKSAVLPICRTRWVRTYTLTLKTTGPKGPDRFLAERVGFEPTKGYKPLLVFKTSAFNRSATSPEQ